MFSIQPPPSRLIIVNTSTPPKADVITRGSKVISSNQNGSALLADKTSKQKEKTFRVPEIPFHKHSFVPISEKENNSDLQNAGMEVDPPNPQNSYMEVDSSEKRHSSDPQNTYMEVDPPIQRPLPRKAALQLNETLRCLLV